MKKVLAKGLALAFVGSLFMAGSAMALPWDSLSSDWVVSGSMDYWTVTDLTTGEDGDSFFQIQLEQASYESGFGLYTVNESGALDTKYEVFAPLSRTVYDAKHKFLE